MISNKQEYYDFLHSDMVMSHIVNYPFGKRLLDRRFKFYKSLRLTEYYTNCRKDIVGKIIGKIFRFRHKRLCNKYGWTIPINVFDKGLSIVHVGTIVVSDKAKIGKNCRIHVDVNIGDAIAHGMDGAPTIGDNVYIAPGVKIFGGITIGDNVAIGANAVVNRSFENGNCTIVGVPAKKISDKTSKPYILESE